MYGTDQAASLSPIGLKKLVGEIKKINLALGDGKKRIFKEEIPIAKKLKAFKHKIIVVNIKIYSDKFLFK